MPNINVNPTTSESQNGNGGNWVVKINGKQEIINEDNIKLL